MMEFIGFEWDRGNRAKCQKHGVSIREIEALFRGTFLTAPDPLHSEREERLKAFGKTSAGRDILVAFTIRDKSGHALIRPISARYMHKKEIDYYEKETANLEKR